MFAKLIAWLKAKEQKVIELPEDEAAPATAATAATPVKSPDMATLKALLIAAGYKVENDFDLLVQVASK